MRNVKDTTKRAEAFKSTIEKAGGRFVSEYYTFGRYDIVTIVEAPNDETIMSIILATGSLGNVRSETLKAFLICEAAKIIDKLPLRN
jgi:uncharacterized protein with GYD domain